MEELSLIAPAIVGLAVAIGSLAYARHVAKHRHTAPTPVAASLAEEPPLPFEFSPPTVLAEKEGTVPARSTASVH
jgi:hypothetical protein